MEQPPTLSPAALARLLSRRVPAEKRQRTLMSCDFCKRKRCKCFRQSDNEACRACTKHGQVCRVTEPRKQRIYHGILPLSVPGPAVPESSGQSCPRSVSKQSEALPCDRYSLSRPTGSARRGSGLNKNDEKPLMQSSRKGTTAEALFEDLLGLPQYIGPTGSYTLLVSLRQIFSVRSISSTVRPEAAQTMGLSVQYTDGTSPNYSLDLPPRNISDALVDIFFAKVHRDFPIFHRAIFHASYENIWSPLLPEREPAWLMTFYMVLVLALEVSPDNGSVQQRLAAQSKYLDRAKALLPEVIVGCTLGHVQALMLYCLQLHISRERNACWNIIGSTIRVAIAIGLHRNGTNPKCNLLEWELRKRVWWTLYSFERIECSSLGRPSAIDDVECNTPVPTEGFLDMGDILPIGYLNAQSTLLGLIGTICKNQYSLHDLPESHVDFAKDISRQVDDWQHNLSPHLRGVSQCLSSHLRSIIMLQILYQYSVTLLARPFLAAKMSQNSTSSSSPTSGISEKLAKRCTDAAIRGMELLSELFVNSVFNSKTSWDVYYMESFAMILALGKFAYEANKTSEYVDQIVMSLETGLNIIKNCDGFSGTMERFARVTADLSNPIVVAAKSQGQGSPSQGGSREDTDNTPETHSTETQLTDAEHGQDFGTRNDLMHDLHFLEPWVEQLPAAGWGPNLGDLSNGMSWEEFGQWVLQHQ